MKDIFQKKEVKRLLGIGTGAFLMAFLLTEWVGQLLGWDTKHYFLKGLVFFSMSFTVLGPLWHFYFSKRFASMEQNVISEIMEKESAFNQLKAAEDQLYHSIEKYQNLISNMSDIFWVSDLDGHILFINDICETILGYKKEDMLGTQLFRFMCPLHVYGVGNCVNIVAEMNHRDFQNEELWMLYVDGHTRKVLEVNTKRVFFEGSIVEIQGVGRDITERIRLERKIKKSNKQLVILNDISSLISRDLLKVDQSVLFENIAKKIVQELNIPLLNIRLMDDEGKFGTVTSAGSIKDSLSCGRLELGSQIMMTIQSERQPMVVEGLCQEVFQTKRGDSPMLHKKIKTILVPMVSNDLLIGLLSFCVPEDFDMELMTLLNSLSNNIALAVEKLGLYQDIKQFYLKVIKTLIAAMEAKDIYTQGHSVRVAHYSVEIAKRMQLSEKELEELEMAGLLHDIGKIGINDAILTKAGKLEKEEYELIKRHPLIGKRILEPIGFSTTIIEAVLLHHKRYDLKGYPEEIVSNEQSIFSRIIGAADAYDAMTSNRSYKNAMTKEMVIAELTKYSGSQFCPDVVNHLVQLIKEDKLELDTAMIELQHIESVI
jgi:PAS domain S-box-containing protein